MSKSSRMSTNRNLSNTCTDIDVTFKTIQLGKEIGTVVAEITRNHINNYKATYSISDTENFNIIDNVIYTKKVFQDDSLNGSVIQITTTDGVYSYSKNFTLYVQQPPTVSKLIKTLYVVENTRISSTINLKGVFSDINADQTLLITAVSENTDLLTTSVNGHVLTISYHKNKSGSSIITLTAEDNFNGKASMNFVVVVVPKELSNNVTITQLPLDLPTPNDSFTILDETYINLKFKNNTEITQQTEWESIKSNIATIFSIYQKQITDPLTTQLKLKIDALQFGKLDSALQYIQIVDGSKSTYDNPYEVTVSELTDFGVYIHTVNNSHVLLKLNGVTFTVIKLGASTFQITDSNDLLNPFDKSSGEYITIPSQDLVVIFTQGIIVSKNTKPTAYNIDYVVNEDSTNQLIDMSGVEYSGVEYSRNQLSYVVSTAPSYGNLDMNVNVESPYKTVYYSPNSNYYGSDTFTYYVKDIYDVSSNIANVNINVININDIPVFTSTPIETATQDTLYNYNIALEDKEPHIVNISTNPLPEWLTLTGIDTVNRTAILEGTPIYSNVRNYEDITIIAIDASGGTSTQTFNINVVNKNDPPVFTSTPKLTVNQDKEYAYEINVKDADDEVVDISMTMGPSWLTLNYTGAGTDPSITKYILKGTPTNDDVGHHEIVIRAEDTFYVIDQSFNITVNNVNDPPRFTSTPISSVYEDVYYSYKITVDDVDLSQNINISMTEGPNWLSLTDNSKNVIDKPIYLYGTPDQRHVRPEPYPIIITAKDPSGGSVEQSFNITVINVNNKAVGTLLIHGTPDVGNTLTANTSGIIDVDSSDLTYTYQWQLSDDSFVWKNIHNETNNTHVIPHEQSRAGSYVRLLSTSMDIFGGKTNHISDTQLILDKTKSIVYFTGIPMIGNTLEGKLDKLPDRDNSSYTYQWQSSDDYTSWTNINNATNISYELINNTIGKYIRLAAVPNSLASTFSYTSSLTNIVDISLSHNDIYEGFDKGVEIGSIQIIDNDMAIPNIYTYGTDTPGFSVKNNKLISDTAFSYGSTGLTDSNTDVRNVDIRVTDDNGITYDRRLTVNVLRTWEYGGINNDTVVITGTLYETMPLKFKTALRGGIVIPSIIYDLTPAPEATYQSRSVTRVNKDAFVGINIETIQFGGDGTFNYEPQLRENCILLQNNDDSYKIQQID
jgi:hypothetical protein